MFLQFLRCLTVGGWRSERQLEVYVVSLTIFVVSGVFLRALLLSGISFVYILSSAFSLFPSLRLTDCLKLVSCTFL